MHFKIILFSLATLVLTVSHKIENNKEGNLNLNSPVQTDTTTTIDQRVRVEAFNLNILPPSSGVKFYKDGIVFLSSSKSEGKMLPEHISFGKVDTWYAVLNETTLENPQLFSASIKFAYPTEAYTFSSDYRTLYFTRYSENEGVEKIYQARFSAGSGNQEDWSVEENPMSFCSGQSTYTHPALSAKGNIMVFASNRTGSIGGMDLFVTEYQNGTWSDPVNLGNAVNTQSNELYPYLDSDNNLYYSSDGIQGYGGYDIYVCKFKSNTWEKPINLSIPVNTRFDDVAFTLNRKDEVSAFYTVKQNSGKTSQQLYKVTMNSSNVPDTLSTLSQIFTNPAISHIVILVTEPPVQATDRRPEIAKPVRSENDIVVYRVQFLTSFNPGTRSMITVDGTDYSVYDYLYSGAYRLCVGEFSSIAPAIELRNILRQNDYPQASVVVFANNVISFDPELLKEPTVSEQPAAVEKAMTEPVLQEKPAETKVETIKKEIPEAETQKTEPAKATVTEPEVKEAEPVKTEIPETAEKKDIVVYRIQFASSTSSKGSYKISINGKSYNTFEYFYKGAYRSTVGELSTLSTAKEFQTIVRQSGYPTAFVVAFKNNVRSLDPELFK